MIMKIVSRFKRNASSLDVDNLHVEVEATRLAYAARDQLLADPSVVPVPVSYLLSDELADQLAQRINLSRSITDMPVFSGADTATRSISAL